VNGHRKAIARDTSSDAFIRPAETSARELLPCHSEDGHSQMHRPLKSSPGSAPNLIISRSDPLENSSEWRIGLNQSPDTRATPTFKPPFMKYIRSRIGTRYRDLLDRSLNLILYPRDESVVLTWPLETMHFFPLVTCAMSQGLISQLGSTYEM
jgi:hypothetical protein